MQKPTTYQQLQPEDRMTIATMRQRGFSVRAIARTLERAPSTIAREVARNTSAGQSYGSHHAQPRALACRRNARRNGKLHTQSVCWGVVRTLLRWKWSPQQISATLKQVFPHQREFQVSHETIYTAIYAHARGELRRELIACLRHGHSTRLPRSRGTDRRGHIPDMVSIHVRPPEVDDRIMPGHWEGDLIKGAGNRSAIGVLVERTSRLVLLARMEDATAAAALAAFTAKLNAISAPLRQSLTYGQSNFNTFKGERGDGALMVPWNPWLHDHVIGKAIWDLTLAMTANATLPDNVLQIAILVVGARYDAAYEIYAHIAVAEHSGMSAERLATLVADFKPSDLEADESVAYDLACALSRGGVLPEPLYRLSLSTFGQHGTSELIYLVGLYALVSTTLNGFNVPVRERE
jgi:IS30 family transposase